MFYENHRVRKLARAKEEKLSLALPKMPWARNNYWSHNLGKAGLVLLSCVFLASCTNSPLTNQSSMPSNSASPTPQASAPISTPINSSTNGSTREAIAPPVNSSPAASPATVSSPSTSPTRLTTQLDQQTPQPRRQAPQVLPITARVIIADQIIDLEVANTPQEQEIGLMFRTELLPNRGMLFPFQPARAVGFWMKNTLIPLDMVFLHQGIIKKIERQVPPCVADPCPSYGPSFNVDIDQVIELRNGRAAELGLKEGDRLTVEFLP